MLRLWPAYLCVAIDFVGFSLAYPITPTVVAELGGTAADASMLLGAFNAAQFVGSVIMGRVSDKIGRKPVILMSLLASSLSFVLAGFANSLAVLFVARAVCGICGGTLPVAQAMVLDVVSDPAERPKFIALCGAGLGVGFSIGPIIGGISAELFGASGAWFSAAVRFSFAVLRSHFGLFRLTFRFAQCSLNASQVFGFIGLLLAVMTLEESHPTITGAKAAAMGSPEMKTGDSMIIHSGA